MPDDPNIPITPYPTPLQLQQQYDYAKALQSNQFPRVQSWTQGASNMLKDAMAGYLRGDAARQQQQALGAAGADVRKTLPPQTYPPGAVPTGAIPYAPDNIGNAPSAPKSASPGGASTYSSKGGSNVADRKTHDEIIDASDLPTIRYTPSTPDEREAD